MLQRERAAGRANLRLGKPNSRAACVMISMLRWCRRACHVLGPGGGCERAASEGGACAGPDPEYNTVLEYAAVHVRTRVYGAVCAARDHARDGSMG